METVKYQTVLPNEYDIKVEKLTNKIIVRWAYINSNNGESMSIGFQNARKFLDFCDIISKAKYIYINEHTDRNQMAANGKAYKGGNNE